MDIDGLPLIGTGVDFTQVEALNQKRTLAFVNHFITSTVSFLNKFSRSCEIRLQECESRIRKMEAAILILESKLSSIPGLGESQAPSTEIPTVSAKPDTDIEVPKDSLPAVPEVSKDSIPAVPEVPKVSIPAVPEIQPPKEEIADTTQLPNNMIPISEDPILKQFFKMLKVGVPEPAVRLKMTQEGIDPDLLKNPNQLVPAQSKTELPLSDLEES